MNKKYDIIIIGAGPAGLASAMAAYQQGVQDILIIERDHQLGGILNQCIHNGFGLHQFKEELTGPEYAGKYIDQLSNTSIEVLTDTMVLDITADKKVIASSSQNGYMVLEAKSIILNMGCRERTRSAIVLPGDRPSGILTAGTAQRYVNIEGYLPGKRVLILGSGDIGLIMARRMSLEGAKVLACVELMPYSSGLQRNIVQCLNDFNIPLYVSHTIVDIQGKSRLEKVVVAKVDENREPIPGTEMEFEVDCLLLSVGLIPENELTRKAGIEIDPQTKGPVVYENMETSSPGIFAAGNVVHVHDLVDFVSQESQKAGISAARYITLKEDGNKAYIQTQAKSGIAYCVPQKIRVENVEQNVSLFFRVNQVYSKSQILIKDQERIIAQFKREHMAPGEMESVQIPKVLLEKMTSNILMIEVQGEKS